MRPLFGLERRFANTPKRLYRCRFWHKADMLNALTNVGFWGQSGHDADTEQCRLMTCLFLTHRSPFFCGADLPPVVSFLDLLAQMNLVASMRKRTGFTVNYDVAIPSQA